MFMASGIWRCHVEGKLKIFIDLLGEKKEFEISGVMGLGLFLGASSGYRPKTPIETYRLKRDVILKEE